MFFNNFQHPLTNWNNYIRKRGIYFSPNYESLLWERLSGNPNAITLLE